MRTAKEICKDSIKQLGYGTDEAFIQSVIDEATAYGMTISAEIAYISTAPTYQSLRKEILTSRDNKVWRKE